MAGTGSECKGLSSSIRLIQLVPHRALAFRMYCFIIILLLPFSVAMAAEVESLSLPVPLADGTAVTAPWASQDVGPVGVTGRADYSGDLFSVKGSGHDIWGTADGFRYYYRELTGDGEIVARVAWIQNTNASAKAGVMIRETLAADSKNAIIELTPGNGVILQRRVTTGGFSTYTPGPLLPAPYWVRLVRSGSVFTAYASSDGVNWSFVGSSVISMTETVHIGLAVTSHDNTQLCTSWFDNVKISGANLSFRWSTADVGAVGLAGSVATGTFTVRGSGEDIWGTTDSFRFVYQQLAGDGQITARVVAVENTHESAKAGVMIRESLAAGSRNAIVEITPGNGVIFQRRDTLDFYSDYTPGPFLPAPYWVRLVRSGTTVTAYASADGFDWNLVGSGTVQMGSVVYVGLAVTSHDNTRLCSAQFDNVEVAGWNSRSVINVTDLGHLGGNWSEAVAVNEAGVVVGNSKTASGIIHAFKWEKSVMTDLGTSGASSTAVAVNNSGEIIGNNQTVAGSRAFIWRNGVMTDLGTLGGATSEAADINDVGEVVGKSTTATGTTHAFLWSYGKMSDLGTLGGAISYAVDINNAGQIVGTSQWANGSYHGFLWQNGVMTDLGGLSSFTSGTLDSEAVRINETGVIAGTGYYFSHYDHPLVWKEGQLFDLGINALYGDHGYASDINDAGQVVGSFGSHGPYAVAFLWQNGTLLPVGPGGAYTGFRALRINEPGEVIGQIYNYAFSWWKDILTYLPAPFETRGSIARAINDAGLIVGSNADHAVLWTREQVPHLPQFFGVFRGGGWYLDKNGSRTWDTGDSSFSFGNPGDTPLAGRWNGTGASKIGVFRGGAWYLDGNGNGSWDNGMDLVRFFGIPSDLPVVGDWTGNGTTNIGVFRDGEWFLDLDGNGIWGYTDTISTYTFGIPGDKPVTGDWTGSGTTKIGVVRGNTWYLDMNGNGAWDDGIDAVSSFGLPSDVPITGDWTGTGITRIGVVRGGSSWFLDINGNGTWDDAADAAIHGFGIPGDLPVIGCW